MTWNSVSLNVRDNPCAHINYTYFDTLPTTEFVYSVSLLSDYLVSHVPASGKKKKDPAFLIFGKAGSCDLYPVI